MNLKTSTGLFGSSTRTTILLILSLIDESHPTELAGLLGTAVSNVRKAIVSLEKSGAVAGRAVGRTHRISLDPRFYAASELKALLEKMALANSDLVEALGEMRRRPRRLGKPL